MVAFVRRCKLSSLRQVDKSDRPVDESNRQLKSLIDSGALGKLHTIKSGSNDVYDESGELFVLSQSQMI